MDVSELIIKLADGELTGKEKEELKQKLYNNPKLMQEYLTHVQLNTFLKKEFGVENIEEITKASPEEKSFEAEEEALEKGVFKATFDHVKDWNEEKKNTGKAYLDELEEFVSLGLKEKNAEIKLGQKQKPLGKKAQMKKWYYAVAAVAAVLVISFGLIEYFSAPAENTTLFAHYYQPYHFVVEQNRSGDPPVDSIVNAATELYQSGKYAEASGLAKTVLDKANQHVKARFILGLTFIEIKNYTHAIDEFNWILDNHDSFHLESKWYLALCYLKLKENNKASKLLKELSQSKNFYQERAKAILEQMP